MKILEKLKNNSKKMKCEERFVDVDYLLKDGYTEIPKSKIDSVIKDSEYEYPYISYGMTKRDVVNIDTFGSDTINFPFEDRDKNGIYLNEDLKLFFSHKETISINDISSKISTIIK